MRNRDAIIGIIENFVHHYRMVDDLCRLHDTDSHNYPAYEPIVSLIGFDFKNMTAQQQELIDGIFVRERTLKANAAQQAITIYEMLTGLWQFAKPSLEIKQQELN